MVRLAFAVRSCQDAGKKHELEKKYISLRDALELSYEVKAPILLWDKGNKPTCTEYTENFDHRYAHDPDFDLWEDLADHFMQDIYRKNNAYKN